MDTMATLTGALPSPAPTLPDNVASAIIGHLVGVETTVEHTPSQAGADAGAPSGWFMSAGGSFGGDQEAWRAARSVSKQWRMITEAKTSALRIVCAAAETGQLSLPPATLMQRFPSLRLLELQGTAAEEQLQSVTYKACDHEAKDVGGIAYIEMLSNTVCARLIAARAYSLTSFESQCLIPVGSSRKGAATGDSLSEELDAERAAFVSSLLPAWELGPAENARRLHVVVRSFALSRALRAQERRQQERSLLCALRSAGARVHLVASERLAAAAAAELEGLHGVSVYLPDGTDARRDLMPVVGEALTAFAAAASLRHAWLLFSRNMVWDPALDEILQCLGYLPYVAGLWVVHNCHHRWVKEPREEDYDEAMLCFSRIREVSADEAELVREALASGLLARRPGEICSLYQAQRDD